MKLCEEQKVTLFLAILLIVFWLAFVFEVIDWKGLVATYIGDGSMAILVYWLLRKSASNTKEAKKIDAKKKFVEWFYFFQRKWPSYKVSIETGTMKKTEAEQPNTFADQIHISLEDVKCMGFVFKPEVEEKIQSIINDMSVFGYDLRRIIQLPANQQHASKNVKRLLEKGEAIVNQIKAVSNNVDESLVIN